MTKIRTRRLVESAILIAIGFILSFIKLNFIPTASISLFSMLPIIMIAYKYGASWGMLCGFVHGLLQMVEGGIDTPPTETFWGYLLVVMLDYILAFTFIGIAGLVRNVFKNPSLAISLCCVVGIFSRFIFSYLSGVIIWGVYAPEGQSPELYSLIINGTKFGVEGILTIVVGAILFAVPILQKYTAPISLDQTPLEQPSI